MMQSDSHASGTEAGSIIDVTAYGAVPNDGLDDADAVLKAVQASQGSVNATLLFPRGTYNFTGSGQHALFPMDSYQNLTIDGQGSVMKMQGIVGLFSFAAGKNITLKDFTVDWDRPPFSIGEVVSVGQKHFDVLVFPEYPISGGEPVAAYMDYDPATKLPRRHGLDEYHTVSSTLRIAPQTLRVNLTNNARIQAGSWVVLRHQVYDRNVLHTYACDGVTLKDITIHTGPGMAFYAKDCRDILIERIRVVPTPGTGRLMSTTADALHISGTRGFFTLKDSEFEGMGDDAGNIKAGLYLEILQRVDNHTVIARHNLKIADPPAVGDVLEISSKANVVPFASAVVQSVQMLPTENQTRIQFVDALPQEANVGFLLGNASKVAKVRISNCEVRNNRARGFLIQNRDVVVEDSRFINCTSGGVWVFSETWFFFEAIGSRNVVVRNNTFENCNYGGPLGEAVLGVYALTAHQQFAPDPGVHRDILLEGNIIRGADNSGIIITSSDMVVLRNNVIEDACRMPTLEAGSSAIFIESSRNVILEGNTAIPDRQGDGSGRSLGVGQWVDIETLVISNNTGFQWPEGTPINLQNMVVTGVYPEAFYVSAQDRSFGVRVAGANGGLAVGDRVNIVGTRSVLRQTSGKALERMVEASLIVKAGSGIPLEPLAMRCVDVGGADIENIPGVQGGIGLNNIGSLVRISGRVTHRLGSNLMVSDGSPAFNLMGASPARGVMVRVEGFPSVNVGDMVQVTGIVQGSLPTHPNWSGNRRYIRTRSLVDVVKLD